MQRIHKHAGLLALVLLAACSDQGSADSSGADTPAEFGRAQSVVEVADPVSSGPVRAGVDPVSAAPALPGLPGMALSQHLALSGRQDVAPTSEFDAHPTAGAAPLPVTFEDLSGGAITSWSWDFGDGEAAHEPEPVHVFLAPGVYPVALTVRGPAGVSQRMKRDFVMVAEPPPTAGFSAAPVAGLAPLDVLFSDQSTGLVTAWTWDFGDAATSTDSAADHTYSNAGVYTVALTVTGPSGSDTSVREAFVHVTEPPPVAAFSALPTSGAAPLRVDFTDESVGLVTTWAWEFGDGGMSSEASPSHSYPVPGTYSVSLAVQGPGGANVQVATDSIVVVDPPPVADFAGMPTAGTLPLSVDFIDLSTGPVTSWSWDFGDGGHSAQASPTYTYTSVGSYTVALTANGPGGVDSATMTDLIAVVQPPPVAAFGAAPTAGALPLDVIFSDSSSGLITAWSWDFGDGGISTVANPVHSYVAGGVYLVSLTVTGPGGADTATEVDLITVHAPPVADFAAAPTAGGAPLLVLFTDLTTGAVTTWSWDFGDGGMSRDADPLHTYDSAGSYTVTLTATGPGGSSDQTRVDLIQASERPVADFSGSPTAGVAPLEVSFSDHSTGEVTSWSWDFGDAGTATTPDPIHTYAVAGTYSVSLATTGPGGTDTITKMDLVVAREPPPVADFSGTPTSGAAPLVVIFTDLSIGPITAWSWDFGDAGTSMEASPAHEYEAVGTFTVRLTTTGPGGSNTATRTDYIRLSDPPVAAFAGTPAMGEIPLAVTFVDGSSGDVTSWSWDFGDGTGSAEQHPSHEYDSAGTFTVALTVAGPGGEHEHIEPGYINADSPARPFGDPPTKSFAVYPDIPYGAPSATEMPTLNPWYDASPYFWISGDEPPINLFYTLVPAIEYERALAAHEIEVEATYETAASTCDVGCQHGVLKAYGAAGGATRVGLILEQAYGS